MLLQVLGPGHDLEEFYTNTQVVGVSIPPPQLYLFIDMHAERQGHLYVEDPTLIISQISKANIHSSIEGNGDCAQAYKSYVKMIVTRTNTKTNVKYSKDPTIFALELANEPHTTDNYEIKHGIAPGTIIKAWIKDMVAFIRTLDTSHMVIILHHREATV